METTALTFARPAWLLALLLVPALGLLLAWSHTKGRRLLERVVAPRLRSVLASSASTTMRVIRGLLVLGAFALAVLALAGPRYGWSEREIPQRGRDIILAVDTSRSMLATDVQPTRLARAKLFSRDLVGLAAGDRLGIVAFAGSAFLQAPLTLDRGAVLASIEELDTTIIPKGGSNIAEAIRLSEKAFGKGEGQTRALVVISDGEELDADGIAAARRAAAQGIRIFTVGIGSEEGSLIPVKDATGRSDFVRDPQGKPVTSRLDAARLREIAGVTGGFYLPLGPESAREIFEKGILPMEATERGGFSSKQPIERYQWPLGIACGLLALWMLFGERRLRAAFVVAAAFGLPAADASDGVAAYEGGDFPAAFEHFGRKLEKSPDSPELQFNAGAAAYKLNDYGKAVDFFARSLASAPERAGPSACARTPPTTWATPSPDGGRPRNRKSRRRPTGRTPSNITTRCSRKNRTIKRPRRTERS